MPASAMLPEVRGLKGPLGCLTEARFGIIWGVTGSARDALAATLDYAGSRTQFGKPIAGFQLTQKKLADLAVQLQQMQLTARRLGELKDAGRIAPHQISFGKFANVRGALEICREARSILGGSGITTEYPVLRHAVNLETVYTYEGTHEVHTLVLGSQLTGTRRLPLSAGGRLPGGRVGVSAGSRGPDRRGCSSGCAPRARLWFHSARQPPATWKRAAITRACRRCARGSACRCRACAACRMTVVVVTVLAVRGACGVARSASQCMPPASRGSGAEVAHRCRGSGRRAGRRPARRSGPARRARGARPRSARPGWPGRHAAAYLAPW